MLVPALEPPVLFFEQDWGWGEKTGPADLEALKPVNHYQSHNPSPEGARPTTSAVRIHLCSGRGVSLSSHPGEMWEQGHGFGDFVPM